MDFFQVKTNLLKFFLNFFKLIFIILSDIEESTAAAATTTSMCRKQLGAWPGLPAARPCPKPLTLGQG